MTLNKFINFILSAKTATRRCSTKICSTTPWSCTSTPSCFKTLYLQIIEDYQWRGSIFSNVADCRSANLLKLYFFTYMSFRILKTDSARYSVVQLFWRTFIFAKYPQWLHLYLYTHLFCLLLHCLLSGTNTVWNLNGL